MASSIAPPVPRSPSALIDSRPAKVESEFAKCAEFCKSLECRGVFLFFGSARAVRPQTDTDETLNHNQSAETVQKPTTSSLEWTKPFWLKTVELSRRLTEWSISEEGVRVGMSVSSQVYRFCNEAGLEAEKKDTLAQHESLTSGFPDLKGENGDNEVSTENISNTTTVRFLQPLMCCAGGGPGFMEAVAEGASCVKAPANALQPRNCAIAIKLPFETTVNPYVSPGCHITVDHFFTRKYWETLMAKAVIVCPGGVGTCEEFLEIMTLQQCNHMPKCPIVLLGKDFWNCAINLQYLVDKGMMSQREIELLCVTDCVDEAFQFIIQGLKNEIINVD